MHRRSNLKKGEMFGSVYGLTSTKADYVIVNHSGGRIMDVWILRDSIISSEDSSDGWIFVDSNGYPTALGGDVKIMKDTTNGILLNKYHEYHAEFEKLAYEEKYSN
jgi:hypothetical protein